MLHARGDLELRAYAPHVVATVAATGSVEQAATAAFAPLFRYISGENLSAEALAMTAPVLQESAGEQLAMTAPVIQEGTGAAQWSVSFVLPAGRPLEECPVPIDPRVTLRAVPEEVAAALHWSGSWTSENIARATNELFDLIAQAGWSPAGEARWARFDPPMQPPSLRRNEIVVPVAGWSDS